MAKKKIEYLPVSPYVLATNPPYVLMPIDQVVRISNEYRIAILFHVFDLNIMREIYPYIENIDKAGYNYKLYINVVSNKDKDIVIEYLKSRGNYEDTIMVNNTDKNDGEIKDVEKNNNEEINDVEKNNNEEIKDVEKNNNEEIKDVEKNNDEEKMNEEKVDECKIDKKIKIIINRNLGRDIGGFIHLIKESFKEENEYDLYLFLHTKTCSVWRENMLKSVIGNEKIVHDNIETFKMNLKLGMIGSQLWLRSYKCSPCYDELMDKLCVKYKIKRPKNFDFIGGTYFWIRGNLIKKYFSDENDGGIDKYINEFNKFGSTSSWIPSLNLNGRVTQKILNAQLGTIEHAYERLFGLIVTYNEYIIGVRDIKTIVE